MPTWVVYLGGFVLLVSGLAAVIFWPGAKAKAGPPAPSGTRPKLKLFKELD